MIQIHFLNNFLQSHYIIIAREGERDVNCMKKSQMVRNDSEILSEQLSPKSLIIARGGGGGVNNTWNRTWTKIRFKRFPIH